MGACVVECKLEGACVCKAASLVRLIGQSTCVNKTPDIARGSVMKTRLCAENLAFEKCENVAAGKS